MGDERRLMLATHTSSEPLAPALRGPYHDATIAFPASHSFIFLFAFESIKMMLYDIMPLFS